MELEIVLTNGERIVVKAQEVPELPANFHIIGLDYLVGGISEAEGRDSFGRVVESVTLQP
ncbi:MAG: hypothetical protein ACRDI1_02465 [Actinomycetota bacterium]